MSKKILIVDDNKPIARALEHKLSAADFTVVVTGNGEEGLKQIEKETPDLIIADLIMPEMNGFDMLQKIDTDKIPVFVFSELTQDSDHERVEKAGAKKVMVKSDTQLNDVVDAAKEFFS